MTRYSTEEVRSIVKQIETDAKLRGLIPMDSIMAYSPGNVGQGISGWVDCHRQHEDGQYEHIRLDFIPAFNYKQTKTDHARILEAVLMTFFAIRRHEEEAERARRSE